MNTIIMSDQHLGKFWKNNNSVSNRGRKLIDYFIYNLENCTYDKPNTNLILAGDLYDSTSTNVELLVYIKSNLYRTLKEFNHVYIIAGNHEIFINKDSIQESLLTATLDSSDKIDIIVSGLYSIENETYNYIFIPFQNELDKLLDSEMKKYLKPNKKNIIIGHFTPKEIFSYEKLELTKYIDKYTDIVGKKNLPYIFLGHYHQPTELKYKNTLIVSISNSYYNTIGDIKEVIDLNLDKRFIEFDNNKITYRSYSLPLIYPYEVLSQVQFDNEILKDIKDKEIDKKDIIYLKSKVIIDYSELVFDGYDVYFDMIENTEENLISLSESINSNFQNNNTTQGKSLNDRWNRYIELIPESLLSISEKTTATWLFNKRLDNDLSLSQLKTMLGE